MVVAVLACWCVRGLCSDDFVGIDASHNLGAMSSSICEEGACHVLLVTGGASQAAVATILAQAIPAVRQTSFHTLFEAVAYNRMLCLQQPHNLCTKRFKGLHQICRHDSSVCYHRHGRNSQCLTPLKGTRIWFCQLLRNFSCVAHPVSICMTALNNSTCTSWPQCRDSSHAKQQSSRARHQAQFCGGPQWSKACISKDKALQVMQYHKCNCQATGQL